MKNDTGSARSLSRVYLKIAFAQVRSKIIVHIGFDLGSALRKIPQVYDLMIVSVNTNISSCYTAMISNFLIIILWTNMYVCIMISHNRPVNHVIITHAFEIFN